MSKQAQPQRVTMTKHTPGPWEVNGSHIYAPDGQIIAQVFNPGSKENDYPLIANRNLMRAAPDLLEALIKAKRTLARSNAFPPHYAADTGLANSDLAVEIDAAIAKARGQS